jgi:hypothetical protein
MFMAGRMAWGLQQTAMLLLLLWLKGGSCVD